MSQIFFKIGSTDFTAYTDIQNCNINAEDVYDTWTDGNWITHRVIVRQRISGTVKIGFKSTADLASFLSVLSSERNSNGYYPVTAYVNNMNGSSTFNAYLDLVGEAKWDLVNGRQWLVQTVSVTGR